MDGLKKWVWILGTAFVAWWFLGRKKAPAVESPTVAPIPEIPAPGDFVSDTRQPDPSSGTAFQLPKQNRILRETPTALAVRPDPLLMKVANTQADLQTAFRKLTDSMTGSLSARIGSTNPTQPTAYSTNTSGTSPSSVAIAASRSIRMTLGGLR